VRRDRRLLLGLVSVAAIALLAYANSLSNGFAFDDKGVIELNEQVHGLEHLGDALSGSYWPGEVAERGLFRPLTLVTYAIDWELWEGRPFGFHLVNVLLHAGVSVLVLFLLLALGTGLPAAWAGAAIFAVHPVHVEAVANVVGRAELLTTLFFLAATLVYLKGKGGWRTALGVGTLYLLALTSKENGVTLPGALVILEALRTRDLRGTVRAVLGKWRVYLLTVVALAAYFMLRKINIGTFLGVETPAWFWGMPDRVRILTAIRVWPEYLRLMLFPADLVPDYGPGVIVPQTGWLQPLVLLGLATGALVALVAWRARRALPLLSAGIAWFALTVLPVMGLLFPVGIILAERTLYLPSVGLAMAVAGLAAWGAARDRLRRPAAAALLVVLALAGARTWQGNPVWRDSLAVLNHLMDHHPANYRVQWGLGNHYASNGDTVAALDHLELATRMVPGYFGVRGQYGELLFHHGQFARAAAQFDTALQVLPENEAAHRFRVAALLGAGRPADAVAAAREGLRQRPGNAYLTGLLARALARDGRYDLAADARTASLELDPVDPRWAQWAHLAALQLLQGDSTAARASLRRAADAAPDDRRVPTVAGLRSLLDGGREAAIPLW
jgi:Flp pilus assembly protein TadD